MVIAFITREIGSLLGRGILKDLLYLGLRTLNTIIPKNNSQILFASIPDYSDNAEALYEYLVINQLHQHYGIVWLVNDPEVLQILTRKGVQTYLEKSVLGLYSIFRSKYIIGTHNHYCGIKARNQYLINLWHGVPLKAMGYADSLETEAALKTFKEGGEATDMLTVTSSIMRNAMVTSFLIDPRKVVITGQPRNDYLFVNSKEQKLAKLLDRDISEYNKLLLYMPTFRLGRGRVEGTMEHLDFLRSELFHKFLKDNNIMFVVKLHPFEEKYWLSQDNFDQYNENIVIFKTERLTTHLISIYEVLTDFDILITDYSSIYFDFLLLNRPIIFLPLDLEEYAQTRGFLLEPYECWTPGPKVTTVEELIDEIQKCISDPAYYEQERNTVNNLINHYQDGKSCERVWAQIQHKIGEIPCKQRSQ
jgi:CDP-glycerol glycerophosphotransferase